MIVWEEFSEIIDGQRVNGRREVDIPGVLTPEQSVVVESLRSAKEARQTRIAEIRFQVIELLMAAVGGDTSARQQIAALRTEINTLRQQGI